MQSQGNKTRTLSFLFGHLQGGLRNPGGGLKITSGGYRVLVYTYVIVTDVNSSSHSGVNKNPSLGNSVHFVSPFLLKTKGAFGWREQPLPRLP